MDIFKPLTLSLSLSRPNFSPGYAAPRLFDCRFRETFDAAARNVRSLSLSLSGTDVRNFATDATESLVKDLGGGKLPPTPFDLPSFLSPSPLFFHFSTPRTETL